MSYSSPDSGGTMPFATPPRGYKPPNSRPKPFKVTPQMQKMGFHNVDPRRKLAQMMAEERRKKMSSGFGTRRPMPKPRPRY